MEANDREQKKRSIDINEKGAELAPFFIELTFYKNYCEYY